MDDFNLNIDSDSESQIPKEFNSSASSESHQEDFDSIADSIPVSMPNIVEGNSFPVTTKLSPKEIDSVEEEIEDVRTLKAKQGDFGFNFRPSCILCQLAYNDPHIHKLYILENFSPTPIMKYIEQVHQRPIKWEQVKNHMDKHFMPIYDELAHRRKEHLKLIKKALREREASSAEERLDMDEEVVNQTIQDIKAKTNPNNMREYLEASKVVATLMNSKMKVLELRLKMSGMGQSAEEQENTANAKAMEKFQMIWDVLDEENRRKAVERWKSMKKGTEQ